MYDPEAKRYFEPFVGCGALYFRLAPRRAQISDINPHLIKTFREIKRDPDTVHRLLAAFPRTKKEYLRQRGVPFTSKDGPELAASFVYINRNCFNGLYRINKAGLFNVPFSNNRTGEYPSLEEFRQISRRLSKTSIKCEDFFTSVANNVEKGDFVYLDPPYAVRDRRIFSEYSYDYFKVEDIQRLELLLRLIHKRKAKFLLSYADNPIISSLTREWYAKTIKINRNIAGFVGARKKDSEVLVSNFRA